MKRLFTLFFAIGIFNNILAQQAKVGQTIPKIEVAAWLGAKTEKEIAQIYEKPIVLYFWTTWCGPCIASFPKLNGLVDKYKDKISFVAIDYESKEKVAKLLAKKPLKMNIAIDKDTLTNRNFGVESFPTVFFIALDKKMLWVGRSDELNSVIEEYLTTNTIKIKQDPSLPMIGKYYNNGMATSVKETKQPASSEELLNISIKKSTPNAELMMMQEPAKITYVGARLEDLLLNALAISPIRTEVKLPFKEERLDIDIQSKKMIANPSHIILENLKVLYNFKITQKSLEKEVYFLRVSNKNLLEKFKTVMEKDAGGMSSYNEGKLNILNSDFTDLVDYLEYQFKTIIVDDTKISFNIDINNENIANFEELKKVLKEKYGLELVKGKSNITFTTIE